MGGITKLLGEATKPLRKRVTKKLHSELLKYIGESPTKEAGKEFAYARKQQDHLKYLSTPEGKQQTKIVKQNIDKLTSKLKGAEETFAETVARKSAVISAKGIRNINKATKRRKYPAKTKMAKLKLKQLKEKKRGI